MASEHREAEASLLKQPVEELYLFSGSWGSWACWDDPFRSWGSSSRTSDACLPVCSYCELAETVVGTGRGGGHRTGPRTTIEGIETHEGGQGKGENKEKEGGWRKKKKKRRRCRFSKLSLRLGEGSVERRLLERRRCVGWVCESGRTQEKRSREIQNAAKDGHRCPWWSRPHCSRPRPDQARHGMPWQGGPATPSSPSQSQSQS